MSQAQEPEASCQCGRSFPVRLEQVGGIVNCPSCGQAVEVPGLRDGMWTGLKVLAAIVWAASIAAVYVHHGMIPALGTAVIVALMIGLVSLAS